jgi:hypothetical protein
MKKKKRRLKMGQKLAEYEGTKLGTYHTVTRGDDGVVYCSCWAWKKNRTCKHLDRFFSNASGNKVVLDPQPAPTTQVIGTIECADDLIQSIDPSFWGEKEDKSENN